MDLFAQAESILELAKNELSNRELDQVGVAVRRWSEEGLSPAESVPGLVEWDKDRIADRLIGYLETAAEFSPDRLGELQTFILKRLPSY